MFLSETILLALYCSLLIELIKSPAEKAGIRSSFDKAEQMVLFPVPYAPAMKYCYSTMLSIVIIKYKIIL